MDYVYGDILTNNGFKKGFIKYTGPEIIEICFPSFDNFISRIEIPYANNRDRLILTLASATEVNTAVLDLDYVMVTRSGIKLDEISEWLEEAHSIILDIFECCITDKCRDMLGEVKK